MYPPFGDGKLIANTRTTTTVTNVTSDDGMVRMDCSAIQLAANLPPPGTCKGSVFSFKKVDATANLARIVGSIDGFGFVDLTTQYECLAVQSNGATYDVLFRG